MNIARRLIVITNNRSSLFGRENLWPLHHTSLHSRLVVRATSAFSFTFCVNWLHSWINRYLYHTSAREYFFKRELMIIILGARPVACTANLFNSIAVYDGDDAPRPPATYSLYIIGGEGNRTIKKKKRLFSLSYRKHWRRRFVHRENFGSLSLPIAIHANVRVAAFVFTTIEIRYAGRVSYGARKAVFCC